MCESQPGRATTASRILNLKLDLQFKQFDLLLELLLFCVSHFHSYSSAAAATTTFSSSSAFSPPPHSNSRVLRQTWCRACDHTWATLPAHSQGTICTGRDTQVAQMTSCWKERSVALGAVA